MLKRRFWIIILAALVLQLFPDKMQSQNAPVTTLSSVGNALPGQVTVPVTVVGFSNIGAVSLTFEYNYSGLHFVSGTPNSALAGSQISDSDMGNGKHRIIMGYYGQGTTLPDGSAVMTVNFTYVSGITALEWFDNGASCEYADNNYNVLNDIPASTYYINGYVCGSMGNPGTVAGSTAVCQGQQGVVYSVAPVVNATGYLWSVPPGAAVVTGAGTNSVTVDYSATAASGNVTVNGVSACGNGPASSLPVAVNQLPVANAGNNVTIPYGTSTTLSAASGGTGSFSYQWTPASLLVNPNVQNPQTVNLVSTTVFTVHVTNLSTLCSNADDVVVTVSGGPLSVSPVAMPGAICGGGSAQLFANAGGGSGNYTYTWSCTPPGNPPWYSNQANPIVSPDNSALYSISVHDGFNTVSGSAPLTVYPVPSATITGGDTLCGQGLSTTLTVDLTGTPPWSFTYSNGLTTYPVTNQTATPYYITASLPGTYTVLSVADAHCNGSGNGAAVVAVFPIPPTPVITAAGSQLFSSSCCGNQWYKDNAAIAGATGQTCPTSGGGTYFDIVTLDGCSSDTSNKLSLITGLNLKNIDQLRFYPNPAKGSVTFKGTGTGDCHYRIQFVNMIGLNMKAFDLYMTASDHEKRLDIADVPPGFYLVVIGEGNEKQFSRLILE